MRVLFTDLDGTLLDYNYSFEKSAKAVEALKAKGIPLIFCTSKTLRENEYYREKLGINHPFIVENGSAIYIPKGYFGKRVGKEEGNYEVIELGKPYTYIRKALEEIREKHGWSIVGFGDLTAEEVAKVSGLSVEMAKLAKDKHYNESFFFKNKEEEKEALPKLREELEGYGLTLVRGSRFLNTYGKETSKGKAVEMLIELYKKKYGEVESIAVGDGGNDLPMLKAVDWGILLLGKNGKWVEAEGVVMLPLQNGEGFSEVVRRFVLC